MGYNSGSIWSSFWDTQTSGITDSIDGTDLTTAQMQDINTFLNAGWDFIDETAKGTDDIWFMSENDYPRHAWNNGLLE